MRWQMPFMPIIKLKTVENADAIEEMMEDIGIDADIPEEVKTNHLDLDGRICKIEPIRTTKSGKQNIHFLLANNLIIVLLPLPEFPNNKTFSPLLTLNSIFFKTLV